MLELPPATRSLRPGRFPRHICVISPVLLLWLSPHPLFSLNGITACRGGVGVLGPAACQQQRLESRGSGVGRARFPAPSPRVILLNGQGAFPPLLPPL